MDGFTLMKQLGNLTDEVPVIVITSFSDIDVAVDAIRLGAYDYIIKPFNISQVMMSVRRALDQRRLLLENKHYKKRLEEKVVEKTIDLIRKNKEIQTQARNLEHLLGDLLMRLYLLGPLPLALLAASPREKQELDEGSTTPWLITLLVWCLLQTGIMTLIQGQVP